jgi:hypothetical protein
LNEKGLLQSTRQVDFMKDDKKLAQVARGSDVHVKPKGTDMLTQRDMLLNELNLLKSKNELAGASGKSTMSINKPIASEVDEMNMNLDKEESTCLRSNPMTK